MYHRPPAHDHGLMPQDVISSEDMDLLVRHYKATTGKNPDDFEREVKKFSQEDRRKCAEAYAELRRYGFYPAGYEGDRILWRIELKSEVHELVDKALPGFPRSHKAGDGYRLSADDLNRLQEMARRRFSEKMKSMESEKNKHDAESF